jgi:hypothetical protein
MKGKDTICTLLLTRRSEHDIRVSGKLSNDAINNLEQEIIMASTLDEASEAIRGMGYKVISTDGDNNGREVDYEIELSTTRHAEKLPLGKMPLETIATVYGNTTP